MVNHDKFVAFRIWVRILTCLAFLDLYATKLGNICTFFSLIRMPNFSNQVFSTYVSTLVRTSNLLLIGNKIKRTELWKKGRNVKFYCWFDGKFWVQSRIRFEVEFSGSGSGIWVRILLSLSKNSKENLDIYCFVTF
jgi:hypothetical protein